MMRFDTLANKTLLYFNNGEKYILLLSQYNKNKDI